MKNERNILEITTNDKASKEIIINTILSILRIINISETGITIQVISDSDLCSDILTQLEQYANIAEIECNSLYKFSSQVDLNMLVNFKKVESSEQHFCASTTENTSNISIPKSFETPVSRKFSVEDINQLVSLFDKGWILDANEISEILEISKTETLKVIQLLLSQGKIKESQLNTYEKLQN